ncbi:hypothetical protein POTOM_035486 [Populus tomentosa]|uniref:Uncharacterized protein n=1 Tax=Populus tomentosa TaxID=118781 RepID=A0A8X8CM91_POPTO|nr:hypothetical protein POTOM_035486 [Populus tomentosa]
MGFSKKPPAVDGGLDLDGSKRWVIAGIPLRAPLKPISTNPVEKEINEDDDQSNCTAASTTPTSEEARIPSRLVCPPAPRKRKATFKCNYTSGVREATLINVELQEWKCSSDEFTRTTTLFIINIDLLSGSMVPELHASICSDVVILHLFCSASLF